MAHQQALDAVHNITQPLTLTAGGIVWFTDLSLEQWLMVASLALAVLNIFKMGTWAYDRFIKEKKPEDP